MLYVIIMTDQNLDTFQSGYVKISNRDRTPASLSSSSFTVNMPPDGSRLDNVQGFYVHSIECNNAFTNISLNNNELALADNVATSYLVTLDVGQYSITSFIAELQSKINTAIAADTVVVTQNAMNHLVFTFSAGYNFVLNGTTAKDKIGLTADTVNNVVNTMQSIPNLTGETSVYVYSNTLATAGLIEPSGSSSVVDILPLDQPYTETCYSNYNEHKLHQIKYFPYESQRTLRSIDIELRNSKRELLVLPDNFEFIMVIKCFYR